MTITTIGLDADDTLWHNERIFRFTQERFAGLLAEHASPARIGASLLETEKRNLAHYGFGVKGFTLSMIETAIEVTAGKVPSSAIAEILAAGRDMLAHPVEPLPGVLATLEELAEGYRLVLVTKGDLFDQERKLAASGLGEFFDAVEIVTDKTPQTYRRVFSAHGDGPAASLMAGNSLKSDVVPAIEAGAWGIHVHYELTWELEHAEAPVASPRYREIEQISDLPQLVARINASG